jgi:hypothetical protein
MSDVPPTKRPRYIGVFWRSEKRLYRCLVTASNPEGGKRLEFYRLFKDPFRAAVVRDWAVRLVRGDSPEVTATLNFPDEALPPDIPLPLLYDWLFQAGWKLENLHKVGTTTPLRY